MQQQNGYTVMHTVIRNNVLGAVIAPRGTEHLAKEKRQFVWRASIRPLLEEVAACEDYPHDDIRAVSQELYEYCLQEGLAVPLGRADRPRK